MLTDISKAKALLSQENCTCVLCRGDSVFLSHQRGVRPLLDFLESSNDFRGYSAADKVVGKATAFLYCLLGITALHAQVLSRPAKLVLEDQGIAFTCDCLVEGIRNRDNTGPCPMEKATCHCATAQQALTAIGQTLKDLQK